MHKSYRRRQVDVVMMMYEKSKEHTGGPKIRASRIKEIGAKRRETFFPLTTPLSQETCLASNEDFPQRHQSIG
jgi:hypothetical protein